MTARRTAAYLLGLALFASGCGALLDGPPANRCASDDDCAAARCNVELGMCVTAARGPMRVGIEVLPAMAPTGGTPVLVSFPDFELEGPDEEHPLMVPSPVDTTALVTSGGEPVTADVTFTLRSAFEGGQSARIPTQSRPEEVRDARGRPSNLSVQLLPSRTYDITVTPNGSWGSRLPPLRIANPYYSPAGTETYLDFLSYPDLCSATVLLAPEADADCLVAIEGVVVDTDARAQDGMLVRVVHATSGQVLSSTFTTGSDGEADAGYFRVVLHVRQWLDPTGWVFSITPGADRIARTGPSPTFTVDPSSLFEDAGRVTILTPDTPNVVTYAGWVEAAATSERLANATLSFASNDVADSSTGVVGRLTATATTGADPDTAGQFAVQLLPGTYEVVVTPDATSSLGILRQQVTIGASAEALRGQLFQVPARAAYGGTVQTPTGFGMIDARVRARPRGTDWMGMLGPVAAYARSSNTITDADGRFGLSLDVGVFDVVVEPPAGTNYPWLVVADQPIGGSGAPLTNLFELDTPVTVSGVATSDGETPVANAEIRAYAIVERTDTTTRAIQIGRAETDTEGRYTLLLPPSI